MSAASFDAPFSAPPDIVLDLPAPMSVNRTRRVNWAAQKNIRIWTDNADAMVFAQRYKRTMLSRFELKIVVSETFRLDLDNGLKQIIDYLRRIEIIEDDGPKHMRKLTIEFGIAPEGCRVTVRGCE